MRALRVSLTAAVVAAVLVAGFGDLEAWPFTSWRLFAGTRAGIVYGWDVRAAEADGTEQSIVFDRLPRPYRAGLHLAADLQHRPPAEVERICREWGRAWAAHTGSEVEEVRVYRTNREVVRPGDRRPPPVRILRHRCELP